MKLKYKENALCFPPKRTKLDAHVVLEGRLAYEICDESEFRKVRNQNIRKTPYVFSSNETNDAARVPV